MPTMSHFASCRGAPRGTTDFLTSPRSPWPSPPPPPGTQECEEVPPSPQLLTANSSMGTRGGRPHPPADQRRAQPQFTLSGALQVGRTQPLGPKATLLAGPTPLGSLHEYSFPQSPGLWDTFHAPKYQQRAVVRMFRGLRSASALLPLPPHDAPQHACPAGVGHKAHHLFFCRNSERRAQTNSTAEQGRGDTTSYTPPPPALLRRTELPFLRNYSSQASLKTAPQPASHLLWMPFNVTSGRRGHVPMYPPPCIVTACVRQYPCTPKATYSWQAQYCPRNVGN